jgi:predicted RNA polymerase sigma factor
VQSFDTFYRRSKDACYRAVVASLADVDAANEALDEAMVFALGVGTRRFCCAT